MIHVNRQAPFLCLWHDYDRTGCNGDDFLRHAAEQQTRRVSSSSPADNGYCDVAERRFELTLYALAEGSE